MSLVPFEQLPGDSRLWTFHAERTLNETETTQLRAELETFLQSWAAHRPDLTAGYQLRYNKFLQLGGDESRLPPSGCSIDSLVHELARIGGTMGIELVDSPDIAYRATDGVHCTTRDAFAEMAVAGTVSRDTIVFDRTAQRVADVDAGRWERPAGEAWHARAFDLQDAAEAGTA